MHADLTLMLGMIVQNLSFLPGWLPGGILLLIAGAIAVGFHRSVIRLLRPYASHREVLREVLQRTERLIRITLVIAALGVVLPATGFPLDMMADIGRALFVGVNLVAGWAALIAIDVAADLYLRRWDIAVADNLLARKHVTQVRVLRRAANTLIVIVTIAIALMTIPTMRQYGVSLFASAGAAGLVIGLAARPLLTNLIAGVQIAMTQPIRVEDAVVVEGEWGWIEEIASTYVVVRIWDWRRLVLPLSYFIENPFQNWTRQAAELIGSVHLYVDYSVPIDTLRAKTTEFAKASRLWDGKVVNLQVVEATEKSIQLRILVSARNSSDAWDLRCEMREKLIDYLRNAHPDALPKLRTEIQPAEQMAI
jgi:small-conductance mechanosensitive channel